MGDFNFSTMISDEMAHQMAQPCGLVVIDTYDDDDRPVHILRRWREDGLCEAIHSFDHEDEAYGVRDLIVEYVERNGATPARAIAQAMIAYQEALAAEQDALGYVG